MSTARAAAVVVVGFAGLAAAMGVGRFALTPILPVLVAEGAVTLGQGSALAAANYAGYLVGAMWCALVPGDAGRLARGGLVAVAASTLAMGVTASLAAWFAWRFVARVASALALGGPIVLERCHRLGERGPRAFSKVAVFPGVGRWHPESGGLGVPGRLGFVGTRARRG